MCTGMDTGLMIIELRKYNPAEELLIGCKSMRLVNNRNMEQGESVAKAAFRMRETGDKARKKIQGCIYPTSNLGRRECVDPQVLEPERGINKIYETKIA